LVYLLPSHLIGDVRFLCLCVLCDQHPRRAVPQRITVGLFLLSACLDTRSQGIHAQVEVAVEDPSCRHSIALPLRPAANFARRNPWESPLPVNAVDRGEAEDDVPTQHLQHPWNMRSLFGR
jgi:hypothetical protein